MLNGLSNHVHSHSEHRMPCTYENMSHFYVKVVLNNDAWTWWVYWAATNNYWVHHACECAVGHILSKARVQVVELRQMLYTLLMLLVAMVFELLSYMLMSMIRLYCWKYMHITAFVISQDAQCQVEIGQDQGMTSILLAILLGFMYHSCIDMRKRLSEQLSLQRLARDIQAGQQLYSRDCPEDDVIDPLQAVIDTLLASC